MKKLILSLVIVAGSATVVIGLCSSTNVMAANTNAIEVHTHNHVASQGKHCNGTVGCGCSGFSPKTNGKEWDKSYCKKCGHHRRNHH